ncbi:putative amidophosphoribosyltransferase [Promicromonospora sp. AC04]|uniref:ComF family protein n=1 Tax=Promicromonospora sp. AC04 TaxID=2135723 RepID=UPI000D4C1EFD|nr:phosphoribosyltransferase family protein [Promicromonospora sp. AC04]PUB22898.1 putative amidophosphoribosyltransferase [Promicromonospora sp. AC04]
MSPIRLLARLLLPVACPCGELDVPWCTACAALLAGPPVRAEQGAPRLDRLDGVPPVPVWTLTPYAGPVRDVVVHWKDRGRADLDRLLAPALRRAAARLAPVLSPALDSASVDGPPVDGAPVAVVPVPSTGAARRARGREPVAVLARAVAGGLHDAGMPARVVPALARRGPGRDQVGLGARARGRNLSGSVRMTRRGARALGQRSICILVDDVLTTGATLAAVEQALEEYGHDVLGATVLAATPPPAAAGADRRTPAAEHERESARNLKV